MLLNLIGRSCLTGSETSDPLRSIMLALTARALFSSCIWRHHGLKLGSSTWEVVWLCNYGPTIIDSSSDYQLCAHQVFLDWTGLVRSRHEAGSQWSLSKRNQDIVLKKEIWEIVDYLNTYIQSHLNTYIQHNLNTIVKFRTQSKLLYNPTGGTETTILFIK